MQANIGDSVLFKKGTKSEAGTVTAIDAAAQVYKVRVVRDTVDVPFADVFHVEPRRQPGRRRRDGGFEVGMFVRITDGAFNNFEGDIAEVDEAGKKLRVNVVVGGRTMPVDVDFSQAQPV